MLITVNEQTYNCVLGDNGTLDTLVVVDGIDVIISQETAAEYRAKDGGFIKSRFARFCQEVVIPDNC